MSAGKRQSLLFIGNSFTARNNLPALISRMAAARAKSIEHRLISAGGASLRRHWNAGEARKAIKEGHYDYVVLQEQSTLPIKNPDRMQENVRLFDQVIKGAGAKTALYMTWARQHMPETQDAIADAYTTIGQELGAIVVPVGTIWQKFLRLRPEPVLHDKDRSHPSIAGSYLAACVFLGVLLKESAVGLDLEIAGINKPERTLLQKFAWQECKSTGKRSV